MACSEIRAAKVADCSDKPLTFLRKSCTLERAKIATGIIFEPKAARRCVKHVFDRCYAAPLDANPFEASSTEART